MPVFSQDAPFSSAATPWAIREMQTVCDDYTYSKEVQRLPQVAASDILRVDSILGEGGFASVLKVQVDLPVFADENDDNGSSRSRSTVTQCLALKRLRPGRIQTDGQLVLATTDLANEMNILARLDHENIIKLRGVSSQTISASFEQGPGYFILLDVLEETLHERLCRWRKESKPTSTTTARGLLRSLSCRDVSSPSSKLPTSPRKGVVVPLQVRLQSVALGIAKGMRYLHDQNIVWRDLKPANIGFSKDGTVKLFDFGLARTSDDCSFTDIVGTFRYMAPETVLAIRNGFEADVYSFGVLLWELATLQKPFESYFKPTTNKLATAGKFKEKVVIGGWRPSTSSIPCKATRSLIEACWDPTPCNRPSFHRIWFLLQKTCTAPAAATATAGVENKPRPSRTLERATSWRGSLFAQPNLLPNNNNNNTRRSTSRSELLQQIGATTAAGVVENKPLPSRTLERATSWRGSLFAQPNLLGLPNNNIRRSTRSELLQQIGATTAAGVENKPSSSFTLKRNASWRKTPKISKTQPKLQPKTKRINSTELLQQIGATTGVENKTSSSFTLKRNASWRQTPKISKSLFSLTKLPPKTKLITTSELMQQAFATAVKKKPWPSRALKGNTTSWRQRSKSCEQPSSFLKPSNLTESQRTTDTSICSY